MKNVLLAVAVSVILGVACVAVYFAILYSPPPLKGNMTENIPATETSTTENGIELRLSVEKTTYKLGENVNVTLTVKNNKENTVELSFSYGTLFDFLVYDENLTRIRAWSDGKYFIEIMSGLTLAPGESHSENLVWEQDYFPDPFVMAPPPVGVGRYFLAGSLSASMDGYSSRITLLTPRIEIILVQPT